VVQQLVSQDLQRCLYPALLVAARSCHLTDRIRDRAFRPLGELRVPSPEIDADQSAPPAWSGTRGRPVHPLRPRLRGHLAMAMGTRVAFIWALQDVPWFAYTAGLFIRGHQIERSAIAAAFVLMAVTCTDPGSQ
jgi:hypothetical protein